MVLWRYMSESGASASGDVGGDVSVNVCEALGDGSPNEYVAGRELRNWPLRLCAVNGNAEGKGKRSIVKSKSVAVADVGAVSCPDAGAMSEEENRRISNIAGDGGSGGYTSAFVPVLAAKLRSRRDVSDSARGGSEGGV